MKASLNRQALKIFEKIVERSSELDCSQVNAPNGTTLLDAGVNVLGSDEAGRLIGEICLGGLGEVKLDKVTIGDVTLRAASVTIENVTIATLCSQYAG